MRQSIFVICERSVSTTILAFFLTIVKRTQLAIAIPKIDRIVYLML